jgi:hypothetical protein
VKFALTGVPDRYTLPGRPAGPPSATDAHKQTQFLLGEDLALLERAMNAQLSIVASNKKSRTAPTAALVSFWSRTFSHLADTAALTCTGAYASCPPLLRAALDCIAAQRSLMHDGFTEYEEWMQTALTQMKEHQALGWDLGRYRAGSVLAEDEEMGVFYRLLTDLSMPHFGSTAFLTGPESGPQRLTLAFADSAFHLGWAQLTLGWLLTLAGAQLRLVLDAAALSVADSDRREAEVVATTSRKVLADPQRCRVEEVDGRFLFHNFRRTASGQPKRVML